MSFWFLKFGIIEPELNLVSLLSFPLSPSCPHRFKPTISAVHHVDGVTNGRQQPVSVGPPQRRWAPAGSDVDSDEEIRRMVAAQDASRVALRQEVDEDNLEVVGLDYLTKSDRSCHQRNGTSDLFIRITVICIRFYSLMN